MVDDRSYLCEGRNVSLLICVTLCVLLIVRSTTQNWRELSLNFRKGKVLRRNNVLDFVDDPDPDADSD